MAGPRHQKGDTVYMMEDENMQDGNMENKNVEDGNVENEILEEAESYEKDVGGSMDLKDDTAEGARDGSPPLIYVGPSFPGAKRFTVYTGGLPEELGEKMRDSPIFKGLVIPVEDLAGANAELRKSGSRLGILFREAQKKLTERSG